MHGPFEKSPKGEPNIYQNWSMKLFALPLLLAIALIGFAISHPDVSRWIADGVEAEFAGTNNAPPPAQVAQPKDPVRTTSVR